MRHFTIQKLMLAIAVVVVGLGTMVALTEIFGPADNSLHGRRGQCASNLHNIALALLGYLNDQGAFPSGTVPSANLPPEKRLSWYTMLVTYMDYQELKDAIDVGRPWDSHSNDAVARAGGFAGLSECDRTHRSIWTAVICRNCGRRN